VANRRITVTAAFIGLTAITVGWWALALWPTSAETPGWLNQARTFCFGVQPNGLPNGEGWMALILQPIIMYVALWAIWSEDIRDAFGWLKTRELGRLTMGMSAIAVVAGLTAVIVRVSTASAVGAAQITAQLPAESHPRLNRPIPEATYQLTNQAMGRLGQDTFQGHVSLVTFAFGNCETVCPIVVKDALDAKTLLGESSAKVVVVTLDPWRDVPSRMEHLASRWGLGQDDLALSGDLDEVLTALAAWQIDFERDLATGVIAHPRLVYVVDSEGRIAFGTSGGPETIAELARRIS